MTPAVQTWRCFACGMTVVWRRTTKSVTAAMIEIEKHRETCKR